VCDCFHKQGSFITGVLSAALAAAGDWNAGSLVAIRILIQGSWIRIRIQVKDWYQPPTIL